MTRTYWDEIPLEIREQIPPHIRDHLRHCRPGFVVRIRKRYRVDFREVRRSFWGLLDMGRNTNQAEMLIAEAFHISPRWVRRIVHGRDDLERL